MKIAFWATGVTANNYLNEGIEKYAARIGRYTSFEMQEIIIAGKKRSQNPEQVRETEKDAVLKRLQNTDHLVLLDERGNQYTSRQFSQYLQQLLNHVSGRMVFLAGGAHGFHEQLYERKQAMLALSAMTMPHDLVRVVFLEQLYRAFSILGNEPYHH
ncbi:MAG: 23S rRNA (pseudouridine(1915)-N(3))-methyltransferase RlmH [Bacteroidia bacterium]